MTRICVHQPNYAPWCGYFAKILASDGLVLFNDAQLPQGRSHVTRARIADGKDSERWLAVPVQRHGLQRICDTRVADEGWARTHLRTLQHVYAKADHADEILSLLGPLYETPASLVWEFNASLIARVARYLGYTGALYRSSDYPADLQADARICDLVVAVGGDVYVSGAGGQNYQSEDTYAARGVALDVRTYVPVPYERSGWPFVPGLSVLDALFHLGADARQVCTYQDR